MIALDTNVVVRAIVDDDAVQVGQVRALLERSDLFVPMTVLLETEWVLQGLYGLTRSVVAQSLERLCGLEQVQVENVDQLEPALAAYREGADLAAVLHVLQCEGLGIAQFATFDNKLRQRLRNLSESVALIKP